MNRVEEPEQFHEASRKGICIFGAGAYGSLLLKYCFQNEIHVPAVIVTEKKGNEKLYQDVPLLSLEEAQKDCEGEKIIVALNKGDDVAEDLEKRGFFSCVYLCTGNLLQKIFVEFWEDGGAGHDLQTRIDTSFPGMEQDYVLLRDLHTNVPLTRVHITTDPDKAIRDRSLADRIRSQYGDMKYIPGSSQPGINSNKNAEIFIATGYSDKSYAGNMLPEGYSEIQVGAAQARERICDITDAEGENISSENMFYSECTAHYWIWKNVKDRGFVGVNHYRRKQKIDDEMLDDIRLSDIDLVCALPQYTGVAFGDYYLKYSTETEWMALEEVLKERKDGYAELLREYRDNCLYIPCNIIFAKKEIFDDYCSFMFPVCFEIRKWFHKREIEERRRYMGYLTEILENLYIMKYKDVLKFAYTDIVFTGR
ncbi:MAG: DUF4422 domain-containing protein [Lachnospiraceae bacterium]|nr:DUF4422 domain-containing protein [Lachnospiraceae bacterium]